MSRLIVKGLPKNINEEKLRNIFKEFGSITDISLKFTKEGVFRKFAFIGFDSKENAQKALKKTNNMFIQTSKIIVEECKSFGDRTKPRPWSKYSKESSSYKRRNPKVEGGVTENFHEKVVDMNKEKEKVTEMIMDTGRLFVRNLPYICSEDDLMVLFKKFGEISELQFVIDKKTGKSKGFAIVTFLFPENALYAYTLLDGTIFKGRMLHILPGNEKPEPKEHLIENQPGMSQFQKVKLAKLKSNAGKTHSWNALFLGSNAIADTLAEKLQVEKSDFLAGDVDNSAGVRMALAETRIVRETRDFLISHGVKLDAFSQPAANRSDTIMILKNLPSHIEEDELRRIFERFGAIKQLILPPEGGVSALLEMENKVDAKNAFSALAYSRLRTQPLYLEWASIDVLDHQNRFQKKSVSKIEQGNCTKILVRNIPFQASKKEINQLFSTFGNLRNLRLPKKIGSDQHRGFGFVEYGSKGEAKRAFDALVHSTHLYNRRLVLEWAKTEETVEESRKKTSKKFSGTYKEDSKHSKRKLMKSLDEVNSVEEDD